MARMAVSPEVDSPAEAQLLRQYHALLQELHDLADTAGAGRPGAVRGGCGGGGVPGPGAGPVTARRLGGGVPGRGRGVRPGDTPPRRAALERLTNYFAEHAGRLDYAGGLAEGRAIGSGA